MLKYCGSVIKVDENIFKINQKYSQSFGTTITYKDDITHKRYSFEYILVSIVRVDLNILGLLKFINSICKMLREKCDALEKGRENL